MVAQYLVSSVFCLPQQRRRCCWTLGCHLEKQDSLLLAQRSRTIRTKDVFVSCWPEFLGLKVSVPLLQTPVRSEIPSGSMLHNLQHTLTCPLTMCHICFLFTWLFESFSPKSMSERELYVCVCVCVLALHNMWGSWAHNIRLHSQP